MIEGSKLKALRELAGVQSQAVALRMEISPARVSTIESGRRGPVTPETALRFIQAVTDQEAAVQNATPPKLRIKVETTLLDGDEEYVLDERIVE
jgi:transcriptional regulator with XRE-family HTH domain